MTNLTGKTCTFGGPRHLCGEPAVHSFVGLDGETVYYECVKHDTSEIVTGSTGSEYRLGDTVQVTRYGKTYNATVTKVGSRGAAYASFTYGNGVKRTVRL